MTSHLPLDHATQGIRRLHAAPTRDEVRLVKRLTELLEQGQKEGAAARLNDYCVHREREALEDLSARELAETLDSDVIEHLLASQQQAVLIRLLVGRAWASLRRRMRSVLRQEGRSDRATRH